MTERTIALIPAYNEAVRLAAVVTKARPLVSEVVVIDDGSTDDTAAVARGVGATVLRNAHNRGKGAAIATALEFFGKSDAEFAVFLDADGQHDAAEIPRFIETAQATGAVIVVGSRMRDTVCMPLMRRLANWFTTWMTARLARQRIPDSQCGFRLLRRTVLVDLHLTTTHFETETEMLIQAGRAGHKLTSVPIRTIYQQGRHSRIRPCSDTVRFIKLVARHWR
ncbi:MAG: glycosyltransferase family 2 protein [Verrucomicrobiia bacterium]|jgi:glycosyltransferase involved in cell wall biosynthesis